MAQVTRHDNSTVSFIKKSIETLSWTVLLLIVVVMLLVARYLYGTMHYIPTGSAVALLLTVATLALAGFYLAKVTSVRAIKAIDAYEEKLKSLLRATRSIHEVGYSDVLLQRITEYAVQMTGAGGGKLLLSENGALVLKSAKGFSAGAPAGPSSVRGRGIVGWVVDKAEPVRVGDAQGDARFCRNVDGAPGTEIRSALCVPLMLRNRAIGALELMNKSGGEFTAEDEEMLSHLAGEAALSYEKAKFYEDEKNYEMHLTNLMVESIENISGKRGHAKRVARYALMVADALQMTEQRRRLLYRASILHDIGFLKLGQQVISSPKDYERHSRLGYEILEPINFYADIAPVVLYHHERYDGTGYPVGLTGNGIPLESRILCIAEAFDSMVSPLSYKCTGKVLSDDILPYIVDFKDALQELSRNSGTQFDPELVEVFSSCIRSGELA